MGMTNREFEQYVGEQIDAKVMMYALPGEMWHRLVDGTWERYEDAPPVEPDEAPG